MSTTHALRVLVIVTVGPLLLVGCNNKEPLETSDRPVTPHATAPSVNTTTMQERDLVEKVAQSRLNYEAYLKALRDYYENRGMYDKRVWTEREMDDWKKVRKYRYLVAADLPAPGVARPRDLIAEANELYLDGLKIYKANSAIPLVYDKDELKVALDKFDRIIRQYPNSDKVDDAAFYAGEILKEYFDENLRAIAYYKLAYEADPDTPHPAHFQRAVILDFRLYRRDEALVEYKTVVDRNMGKDSFQAKSNRDFAATRIKQLTTGADHDRR